MEERKLRKGEVFRIAGPEGISKDLWTWGGFYDNPEEKKGYICTSLEGMEEQILLPGNWIIPQEK